MTRSSYEEILRDAMNNRLAGDSTEDILEKSRRMGANMIESIKIVMEIDSISLSKAKKIVHFSRAWNDMRECHDKFHESVEKSTREIAGSDE